MIGSRSIGVIHGFTWLLLVATATGAFLLTRFIGEAQTAINIVNEAFAPGQQQLERVWSFTDSVGRQLLSVLGEAAFILEGEQGLLWLMAFLACILFVLVF